MNREDVEADNDSSLRRVRGVYLFVTIGVLLGVAGCALFAPSFLASDQLLETTPHPDGNTPKKDSSHSAPIATPAPPVRAAESPPQPSLDGAHASDLTHKAKGTEQRLRVLFLGNAHTTLHDIPWQVRQLAEDSEKVPGIDVQTVAEEKNCLMDLWDSGKAVEAIRSGPWDYVVLQERSGDVVYQVVRMHDAITRLDGEIRRQGAKTLLFVAWRRLEFGPEWSQEAWTESFVTAGRKIGAPLVPVGIAWRQALETLPPRVLYMHDGFNSSPAGAYLAACTLFACLTGVSPEGLTARIHGRQLTGGMPVETPSPDGAKGATPDRSSPFSTEPLPRQKDEGLLVDLERELASSLQKVAWETVQNADHLISRPLQPTSNEQWFTMAMVYAQEGNREAAIEALKAYLARGGKWENIAKAGLEELGGE